MDAFISRKRRRLSLDPDEEASSRREDSTELKLAILSSLHADIDQGALLEVLLSSEGSVEEASRTVKHQNNRKKPAAPGIQQQSSLAHFIAPAPPQRAGSVSPKKRALATKKGKPIHLFSPGDVAANTPCSIIHNFLPAEEANLLLQELLEEAQTFERQTFKLFDNVVQSPHTASFYVASLEEAGRQRKEYVYNGSYLTVCLTPLIHLPK
ncbi:MAG: hypothetical protein M1840_007943 [Geoglossum simile]|nr:MAG: hypothetical protein M1840_007943 [Geoglossum simile]